MSINQQLTATGTSIIATKQTGAFAITGTFVATVELQRRINSVWQAIASFSAATATTDDVSFDNGVPMPMRFEVTAYTSGTITVLLA